MSLVGPHNPPVDGDRGPRVGQRVMKVVMNTGGVASTNAYLVADEATGQAVLFDAPDHTVGPLLDQAQQQGWDVVGLWLTHGHFDHVADHTRVAERFGEAKVFIHRL